MLGHLLICVLALGLTGRNLYELPPVSLDPPAVYFWTQKGEGSWESPENWTPQRTAPAPNDILVFSTGGSVTATGVPSESLGQLIILSGTQLNLESISPALLTISGADEDDLVVAAGSGINFAGMNTIECVLSIGTTGRIDGSVTFTSTTSAAHRLMAADVGALIFRKGSVFTAGSGFTGNAFGTTNLNSVVFGDGSHYVSTDGGDPFGAVEPNSVVVFNKGSLFSLQREAVQTFFSGRTYGNFELNSPGQSVFATGSGALVMDDVTVTAGRLYLGLSGDPGHAIRGNISTQNASALLDFSSGTIHLNGLETQIVSGVGLEGAGSASTIVINNPAGVILRRPLSTWNLVLLNGIINTTSFYLEVGGNLSRTNGYVIGNMRRIFFTPGSYIFEIGTTTAYSPVQVDVRTGNWPTGLAIETVETVQPNILNPSKALRRYWRIVEGPGQTTADMMFHYLDGDVPATADESRFVIQKYNGGFTQPAGVIDTAANTFRVNGVTDFAQDWTLAEPSALSAAGNTPFDFDGDGKSDLSVFRPSVGEWYYRRSLDGVVNGFGFGSSTDKPVPVDLTGDGKTDIAFFRPSTGDWYVLRSEDSTYYAFPFGTAGDIPTPADYDGDGMADPAVYRPSAQTWFLLRSTGGFTAVQFGSTGDVPVPADYDGDGKSDVAIYRPSVGQWWILRSLDNSVFTATFGDSNDKPVPGDYTDDGKADIAFYRPSEGSWYVIRSEDQSFYAFPFGNSADKPAPADFDGDGTFDAAVFRPSDRNWYILRSTGGVTIQQFGAANDIPLPGVFIP